MPPELGSPQDWLRYARSDLRLAERPPEPEVLLEMLCFHAQQAVEKSLKAVLGHLGVAFPRTHSLRVLLDLLPTPLPCPPEVEASVALSDYAVALRYPVAYETISVQEHAEAVRLARAALTWADAVVQGTVQ